MLIRIIFCGLLYGLFIVPCLAAFGQNNAALRGKIVNEDKESLIGASVSLHDLSNVLILGAMTDIEGEFLFDDLPPSNYKIKVSYLGYEDIEKQISMMGLPITIEHIVMQRASHTELQEVIITEQAIAVQQKGDTTQYNAGSYKVHQDASAEDLIRKMPGMDMSSGSPKAQGENVAKVLVDGKPFFGEDPRASLRNLPAEVIDKIQVYDEQSEQSQFSGFSDGNTSKTINIITRSDRRQGAFGRIYAGYGLDNKYNTGGNINYFEGKRRISLIGMSNNINIQNFDNQDLLGVSSSGGRGGRRGGRGGMAGGGFRGGGGDNDFMVSQQGGISHSHAIGINYADSWSEKTDITASYFFNNTKNVSEQEIFRNYVLASQNGQSYSESKQSISKNLNHRINLRLTYNIDSSNSILFIPRFSAQTNQGESQLNGQTLLNGSQPVSQTINDFFSNLNGYNASSMLMYRHRFSKKGRTFSSTLNGGVNRNKGENSFYAENSFEEVYKNDTVNQQSFSNKNGWNLSSNITYTEPITTKIGLQARYVADFQRNESDKKTYSIDRVSEQYSNLEQMLSNTFSTDYFTQRGGLALRYSDSIYNFNIGADYQHAQLNNQRTLPFDNKIRKNFNNALPYAWFRYNISQSRNISIFYRSTTSAPSVDQLQDVIDNSNPIQLSTGNSALRQLYQHNLFMRYSANNSAQNSTFFAMLRASITQDYVANHTIIAQEDTYLQDYSLLLVKGTQFEKPINMNGHATLNAFSTYGIPLKYIKSNININTGIGYTRTPGMVNNQKNYSNSNNINLGIVLSSNINENIDFTISTNANYNIITHSLNTNSNTYFYNHSSRFSLNYIFWKGIVFNTEMNHQLFTGMADGFNQNFLLWNASIGKKIFKNQLGEIKIQLFDILGQNASLIGTSNDLYVENLRTNVLQRFAMLTFTYNLRYFKGGASIKDLQHQQPKNSSRGWE